MTDVTNELIDDRELRDLDGDRFRHADVAEQLAEITATAETPANIALFGAWGSGKTGISNLLKQRFEDRAFREAHGTIAYAHFDAFKYADLPLRRLFLAHVAEQLTGTSAAEVLRDRLYKSETQTTLTFTKENVWPAVGVFMLLLTSGLVLALALAAVAAGGVDWLSDDGGFGPRFRTYFSGVVGFSFAPAAVLGGLFAIAGKSLPVNRTSDTPSSEEQLEREFKELVGQALESRKAQRVVVFVDELDRCPPDKVVNVLDTVRTFLDVEKTIFVVAADRQVVERALTQKVEQTTPADTLNPYYSSGSAYLDKVFHYQLHIPALRPQRITRYAIDLVEAKEGSWLDEDLDVPWVISVLVPSHVRSPRRVKTLLNNYTLAYRLARRRYEEGHLSDDPAARALELAKLVCLRTEFPGFARELTLSPRLPELFLLACEGMRTQPASATPHVWEMAVALATDHLGVDEMLDERDEAPDETRDASIGDAEAPESADDEHRLGTATSTRTALRQQLANYLSKTRSIPNPKSDLLYLEGRGFLFDLDESIAEQIEAAAVEGQSDVVISIADQAEVENQANILRLLAQEAQEAHPGLEGDNVVGVLLRAAGTRSDEVLEQCADEAFDALTAQGRMNRLQPDDLKGALILGLGTDRATARQLIDTVLARGETLTSASLGLVALDNCTQLLTFDKRRVGTIAAHRLVDRDTAADAVEALNRQGQAGEAALAESIDEIVRLIDAAEGAAAEVADDAASATGGETTSEDGSADGLHQLILALESAWEKCAEVQARRLIELLLVAALQSDSPRCWNEVEHYLRFAQPIEDTNLAAALIARAVHVETPVIAQWLAPLAAELVDERFDDNLDELTSLLWERRAELGDVYGKHDEIFRSAMSQIARLRSAREREDHTDLVHQVDREIASAPSSVGTAAPADASWGHVRRFVDTGLLPEREAADVIAARVTTTVQTQPNPPADANDENQWLFVERWSLWAAARCSPGAATALVEACRGSWIPTPHKENICLQVAARAAERERAGATPRDDRG